MAADRNSARTPTASCRTHRRSGLHVPVSIDRQYRELRLMTATQGQREMGDAAPHAAAAALIGAPAQLRTPAAPVHSHHPRTTNCRSYWVGGCCRPHANADTDLRGRTMKRLSILLLAVSPTLVSAAWDQVLNPEVMDRIVSSSAPHFWTAQGLYQDGKGSSSLLAFAVGVHDADASNRNLVRPYCVPRGATAAQLADVAWKYLDEHPQQRHLPGAHLVRESFRSAWPCASQ